MGRFDHQELDDVIHSRMRLAIMALLASLEEAEFTFLRDQVGATDGNLVTHLRKLQAAGYVSAEKRHDGARPLTAYRLTAAGRGAFGEYLERLSRLLPK